ncbi:unnamed protein product [Musa acuminata subsp. malaccensis]|uniref:(wild Malaysian banana) hypothetical protein n=1 Tax=Musa acuminata subsp. malaccensis TaxID=214687 RepID=A0A804IGD2_MUSAM|nr:unnamed protein product [Musa acuminata subsp. malaccensis]
MNRISFPVCVRDEGWNGRFVLKVDDTCNIIAAVPMLIYFDAPCGSHVKESVSKTSSYWYQNMIVCFPFFGRMRETILMTPR